MADVPERLRHARSWIEVHLKVRAAKLGVRRPHLDIPSEAESPACVPGFAVSRLGHRRRPGLMLRTVPVRMDQPERTCATNNREAG